MPYNTKPVGVAYSDPLINGGQIDGATVGATTPSTGKFTTLTATGAFGCNGSAAVSAASTVAAVSTSVLTSGFGFPTSAGFVTAVTAINSIITALKANGIMAS